MAWNNNSERTHWSVCIASRNQSGEVGYFLRIMDYHPERKDKYSWVYRENNPTQAWRRTADDPYTLYRPETVSKFQQSEEDYLFIQWTPNDERPDRPRLIDPYTHPHDFIPHLYEVIKCPGNNSIEEFGEKLAYGWNYLGRPTKQVLIAYSESNGFTNAVLMNRDEFTFSNQRIRLKDDSRIYAPYYALNQRDMQELPFNPSNGKEARIIYLKSSLPEKQGKIPVLIVKQYEALLSQKRATLERVEETIRLRATTYDRLEELITPLQERIDNLKSELRTSQSELEKIQQQKELELTELHENKKRVLNQIREQRESELEQIRRQKESELSKIEHERTEALARLDQDVALKLGLRAIIQSTNKTSNDNYSSMTAITYLAWPVKEGNKPFANTLADNLRAYGMVPISDSTSSMLDMAEAIVRSRSATNLLAVDSTFAVPIANAMTYATYGKSAKHISIPADWNDASMLKQLLSNEDNDVLVMDNVFDMVNEGLMFSLSRLESDVTVIVPIGSYGNLRLISSEIWNHLFYLPTEQYIKLPATGRHMTKASANRPLIDVEQQSIVSEITNRFRASVTDKMPISSLVLPSSIATRFESIDSGEKWVSAHIALQTYAAFGMDTAQSSLANGKSSKAADKLLKRMEDSHHAR